MDFGFTEEHHQLRKTIRAFTEAEMLPHVMEWDESQHFPVEIFRKLGDLGVLGAVFPEELGGSGYSYVDYSILVEELARVDPSIALSIAAHVSLCANHIFLAGDDAQRQKYIPKLASGEWIGAWALTEPESGSDAGGTRTAAVRQGDCWVINGSKTFTTNAHIADVFVVMAMTDRAQASHGISAIVVEKGTPGFRPGKKENKLGMRCSPTGELIFTDCRVPAANLIGKQGEGFIDSLRVLDGGRISIAALSVGVAQGAFRGGAQVLQAAQTVRTLHLGIPGHPEQAGRYGHRDRRGAAVDAARGLAEGFGSAGEQGIFHGQVVFVRSRRARRQ